MVSSGSIIEKSISRKRKKRRTAGIEHIEKDKVRERSFESSNDEIVSVAGTTTARRIGQHGECTLHQHTSTNHTIRKSAAAVDKPDENNNNESQQ